MKWALIKKAKPAAAKKYSAWKPELAEESGYRCVYCCIHEGMFGGIRNYHVEHFRPKSKFKHLEHEYSNLFYACSICNVFKGDSWIEPPGEVTNWGAKYFPDPSTVDLSTVLEYVDGQRVSSKFVSGRFLIERLHLNRPQLVLARRASAVRAELDCQCADLARLAQGVEIRSAADGELLKEIIGLMRQVVAVIVQLSEVRPYVPAGTR